MVVKARSNLCTTQLRYTPNFDDKLRKLVSINLSWQQYFSRQISGFHEETIRSYDRITELRTSTENFPPVASRTCNGRYGHVLAQRNLRDGLYGQSNPFSNLMKITTSIALPVRPNVASRGSSSPSSSVPIVLPALNASSSVATSCSMDSRSSAASRTAAAPLLTSPQSSQPLLLPHRPQLCAALRCQLRPLRSQIRPKLRRRLLIFPLFLH